MKHTGPPYPAGAAHWRCAAACRHEDTELFFPEGTTGPALRQAALAKSICLGCPVRAVCLDWALRYGVEFGIWGGTDPDQRRTIRAMLAGRAPAMRASQ